MSKLSKTILARYKNTRHYLTSLRETLKNGYPAQNLVVIGVTGTDGKTTTAHLIYEILKANRLKVALISTVGAWGPRGFIDTGLHTTTPDATVLQPMLKKFLDAGVTHVVLEVTSHGLDQHRVLGCNFYAGVLTNVTHEHLDYHKTFENYRQAKAKLFKAVKLAVLNKDDKSYEFFKRKTSKKAKIVSYSTLGLANVKATNISEKPTLLSFLASDNGVGYEIKTPLAGRYNVSNILASIGIARALKVDWKVIQKVLGQFAGIAGRMEYIKTRPYSVIVDFAHTPNALNQLLTTLQTKLPPKGRLITVFGCAGERDRSKRPLMGEIAGKLADVSVFTAEDPRSEDVNKIIGQIAKGARQAHSKEMHPGGGLGFTLWDKHVFVREPNRGKAIELAIKTAQAGDIVVICGKGHEKSMAFGKTEIPWSDQDAARTALNTK
ncbi:MAG: UDP-N-acetylmuramoyl-L-alanyl-D-glutamate--2,6-diaminopimelate ligase [Candidatus Blackburnbacteria bacterium]|nr:UDP-N-acetylmuramoyl-L-alanyl-D-glutamate--2,6-diaminopimelate ligase [Candidatus Blackburnbacteria bacterium]